MVFSVPSRELGYLDPLSSIIVTIQISRKKVGKRLIPLPLVLVPVVYGANILYSYICRDLQSRSIPILFRKEILVQPTTANPRPPITVIYRNNCPSCFGGGFTFSGYSSSTNAFCNKCFQAIIGCFSGPNFPLAGCIPLAAGGSTPFKSYIDFIKWVQCIAGNPILGAGLCIHDWLKIVVHLQEITNVTWIILFKIWWDHYLP